MCLLDGVAATFEAGSASLGEPGLLLLRGGGLLLLRVERLDAGLARDRARQPAAVSAAAVCSRVSKASTFSGICDIESHPVVNIRSWLRRFDFSPSGMI